jgi:N-acetylglucosamine malate deacetylase 1
MNPYLDFVEAVQANVERARGLVASGTGVPVTSDRKVVMFSPHPDDECLTGLLPLRLMREAGMEVVNVPVTYGSKPERRAERLEELKAACAFLGWTLHARTSLEPMEKDEIVRILQDLRPEMVMMPHAQDHHPRHIATHALIMDALAVMPCDFSCTVAETEFWGAMNNPNLMVESDAPTLADLVAATSLHTGEVSRNPYHLLLPAWMQDNVRRGSELVGGQGNATLNFPFATLYRLSRWREGVLQAETGPKFLSMGDDAKQLLHPSSPLP